MVRSLALFLVIALTSLACGTIASATDTGTSGTPKLKDTLEKGLKARLPSEFAFIDEVISKVDDGTLPRSMVESTFLWARRRQIHAFEYFEQGLKVRAAQIGVSL
ncbi:MAG TPA: hypothetical protein VKB78_08005 [Pirellulales bacterium]|nr:hypothetical protein [Pirellulales bacterium]